MPTQTFWNLPAAKREALITIAVEEFAANDYDTASISRIVAKAGIAKGSLYQYFADKRDLFGFLVDLSNQKRLAYIQREALPEPDMPFWNLLRWQIGASTRAALAYPLLTRLFLRAMGGHGPIHADLVANMQTLAQTHWQALVERGIAQADLRPDLDPQLAARLLAAVFNELGPYVLERLALDRTHVHELDVRVFQTPEIERIFDAAIAMLEHGLSGPR